MIFPRGLLDAPLILTSTSPGHYTDLSLGTGEMFSEDYEGNNEKWDFNKQAHFNFSLIQGYLTSLQTLETYSHNQKGLGLIGS